MIGTLSVVLIVLVVTAVLAAHDVDTRLYRDSWRTSARFPDKAVHFLGAAFELLVLAAVLRSLLWPAIAVAGSAVVWELASRPRGEPWRRALRHSWRDVVAGWIGAAVATAALWWYGR